MAKAELMKRLCEIGAIKFGEFTLKSGKKSPYYIDLRILPSHPNVLVEVGKAMGEMISNLPVKPTRLCGIPAAGLAIATTVGIETGTPVVYTRKEPTTYKELAILLKNSIEERKYKQPEISGVKKAIEAIEELSGFKTHGITRYVDGEIVDGDKIGIIDDLITTAKSKLEARDLVLLEAKSRNIKVDVTAVYVFLDREQGGKEALEKEELKLYSVATISDVVKWLHQFGVLDFERYKIIKDYTDSEKAKIGRGS